MFSQDIAGNTLAMIAAFLIPLSALTGSAVDVSRAYLVKVRLQQACDAGALAGRKFMTTATGSTLDANALAQANAFFTSNFTAGWMDTASVSFTPTRTTDGQVTATALATVPMTIMKMFGYDSNSISVVCAARLDIGDSDIMFVLDTTGSMACLTSDGTAGCSQPVNNYTRADGTTGYYVAEKSGAKIQGLRSAVLLFYDTLAANADANAHIRYGFVPYTSTANVGYLLPSNYLVDTWSYQTRKVIGDTNNGAPTSVTTNGVPQTTCNGYAGRTPTTSFTTSGTASVKTVAWSSGGGGKCVTTTQVVTPTWSYGKWPYDVRGFKGGSSVDDPSKITAATSRWQGCIEERDTTASATFDVNALPGDLDPDLVPTSDATSWRPMWPDVVYYRGNTTTINYAGNTTNPYGDSNSTAVTGQYTNLAMTNNISSGYVSCGKSAQRLQVMDRTAVNSFVSDPDFKPQGGTYHDTGMIWGVRLLSPTGIFASDTAAWPGNNPPNRYIVFMTDGDMAPNSSIYGMYGMESYDQRVTGGTLSNDPAFHNTRFTTECAAAKARNITIFVVGFGQSLTNELNACATPGYAFYASDNAGLQTAFKQIALQVAKLRLAQ